MAPRKRPRYRPWKDVRRDWLELAHTRTDYLLDGHPLSVQPLKTMLANAYLQGIADAAEAMEPKWSRPAERQKQSAPAGIS